jgi:hypothetical protein
MGGKRWSLRSRNREPIRQPTPTGQTRLLRRPTFGRVEYLLLNLINHLDVIGVALNTLPVSFIFGFGTSLPGEHPLDFLGVRHVHSVAGVQYLSPDAARSRTGPEPSSMSGSCPCGQGSPRPADRSQHVADV